MTTRLRPSYTGAIAAIMILASTACRPPAFERYMRDQRWADAARAFSADSALLNDERALHDAAMLYSSPARPTYDPARAEFLLRRLLQRFPNTKYRVNATDRLALITAVDSATRGMRALRSRIDTLDGNVTRLRAELDSARTRADVARKTVTRLESELRDRDDQLHVLRSELRRLKAVDLRPRSSNRPPPRGE